jgi:glycosyltransferase involved in cell wall biosynthesis
MSAEPGCLLTVAVICKNEARNIVRCLESIVRETAALGPEILLVDSWSTDETIERASRFPITILRLRPEWPHSPAAGRFTAVNHARGRYLFLIDGDMELRPGYVEHAVQFLESHPGVAGARGRLTNYHVVDGEQIYVNATWGSADAQASGDARESTAHEVEAVMGAALFRVDAVRSAGNFHPYLKAEEEYELCQRLRRRGARLCYLPVDAVNHFGYVPDPLRELRRRWRAGLVSGIGQVVRLSIQEGFGARNVWRFRQHLCLGAFALLLPLFAVLGPVTPWPFAAWSGAFVGLLLAYYAKKRRAVDAFAALLLKALIGVDIIRGLLVPVPEKSAYPRDVVIVTMDRTP